MSILRMELGEKSYDIVVERGAIKKSNSLLNLNRRVLILTDKGVPEEYAMQVAESCREPHIVRLEQGESNKCIETYCDILKTMVDAEFDRKDCVVAVGGGVMGDLAGFVASTYMRGVDFYNIPTTLLAQIDSSIGGKVAVDFAGYKNIVGAFYQPKAVLVDPNVLDTLSPRQFSCGMAEAIKMFATSDAEMFEELEKSGTDTNIDKIILRSLMIKKSVVEQDEKESGLRKILNFGHTVGHAIESLTENDENSLLHGECVGTGMLCMSSPKVRERIKAVLESFNLPTSWAGDAEEIRKAILHDKKASGDKITVIKVNEIGSFEMEQLAANQIIEQSREVLSLS